MANKIKDSSGTCVLEGVYETDRDLYRAIYSQLSAPEWAGFNLDALFDILSAQIEGAVSIQWNNFDMVEKQDVTMNLAIANVLKEASTEREDMTLTFDTSRAGDTSGAGV